MVGLQSNLTSKLLNMCMTGTKRKARLRLTETFRTFFRTIKREQTLQKISGTQLNRKWLF